MNYVNISYTLEALENRIAFHTRRLQELKEEGKNPRLQEIHEQQIARFQTMLPLCREQGWVYIDKMMS